MSDWTAFTSENSPKIPNRPAPPPPKPVKSTQSKLAKVLSLKQSKSQNGVQQSLKKKPPPRPPPPKFAQPQKSQSKTGLSTLIGFKAKHSVPTPPWVGKQNEIKITSSSSKVACLIDLSSPPTSPTSTHKSSSDGNSVDSFSSDFGPWKESQAESSGFEDDFDLFSSHGDTDFFKKPIQSSQNIELSPPPPSLPPPMLPPDALNVLLNGPQLPPRPNKDKSLSKSQSKCVAQFDYVSNHPDDLVFKQGDEITLIRKINDEWLEGELGGQSGMFPINYVNVTMALLEEISKNQSYHKVVAVFSFKPECWEDLSIQEGDEIQVLWKINDDWLYGECNGSKGQFPSNFVTELPEEM